MTRRQIRRLLLDGGYEEHEFAFRAYNAKATIRGTNETVVQFTQAILFKYFRPSHTNKAEPLHWELLEKSEGYHADLRTTAWCEIDLEFDPASDVFDRLRGIKP